MSDASFQEIEGIRCYAPRVALDCADYPSDGFDVSADVEARSFWCRTRNRVLRRVFERFTDRSRPLEVLEIGCGIGGVIGSLRQIPNLRLTGSEIYIQGLRYARAKMPDVEFIQLDATDIPFRDRFDVVGAFDVLEHIEDDELVMRQVCASLQPGGLFIVTVPQYQWMWSTLDQLVHHKRRYSRDGAQRQAPARGVRCDLRHVVRDDVVSVDAGLQASQQRQGAAGQRQGRILGMGRVAAPAEPPVRLDDQAGRSRAETRSHAAVRGISADRRPPPSSRFVNEPTNPALRRLVIEFAIAAMLLAGSGVWATRFWNAWIASGGQPSFYQNYFEPAVMVACGKGFVVSQGPRPQVLEDFLNRRRDAMACSDLPADLPVGRRGLFTGAWIYLQTTVGWAWRVLGISWSRMGPLFGLLFGIVIALAYGIFRLGMGRALALVGALGLATSCIHLENLPHLRDYAKAPFTLALVLILGILVARPVRRGTLLALAVAYGAVLGIGYGFRTDFLINVPVFLIVVFAFLDGGVGKNLVLKAAASLVCLATFAAVSWPVTSAVYQEGGCQWHVALLGMQSPFDDSLHLAPAPYEFGYAYSDPYVIATVQGFAHRTQPAGAPIPHYCSHEYDVQSGRLLKTIVTTFPGDFVARAYASVLQIAELPFLSWASPLNGWAAGLFDWRRAILEPKIGWGVYAQAAALLIAAGWSLRLGFVPGVLRRLFRRVSRRPVPGTAPLPPRVHDVVGAWFRRPSDRRRDLVSETRPAAGGRARGWFRAFDGGRSVGDRAGDRRVGRGTAVPEAAGEAAAQRLHRGAEAAARGRQRPAHGDQPQLAAVPRSRSERGVVPSTAGSHLPVHSRPAQRRSVADHHHRSTLPESRDSRGCCSRSSRDSGVWNSRTANRVAPLARTASPSR